MGGGHEPAETSNCVPFNTFGIPAVSVPCRFSKSGLPIGLMIAGPRYSEDRVLALAHAYERAAGWYEKRPNLSPDMTVPPIKRKDSVRWCGAQWMKLCSKSRTSSC
ncbi:MAG: amidase family protein [Bryobacteraceae bacterium]